MLNIIYSLKLEELITAFEKKVFDVKIWNDPFNPPLVIFSDSKIEQWIKLHAISQKNDSILMNMHTDKLEGFLFRTLAGGIPNQEDSKIWYEKLNTELLQTLIINKLISKTDDNGTLYYKDLEGKDSDTISTYIENPKDKIINQNNLYSFAKSLTKIFTEYIDSRNDDFENGIHSKWNAEESFFHFDDDENNAQFKKMEVWQRKLYKSILGDNPLTIKSEESDYDIQYVTLAQLVEINKKANNGQLKFPKINQNVFLFGFNSLGQSYRKLLCEIAEHTEMHLFLQTNDVDLDKSENFLLQKWNMTGNSNLKLWKENAKGSFISAGIPVKPENILLKEIQNQIQSNKHDKTKLTELIKLQDNSITVTGAPSKIKEIEAVHSSICQILKESKNAGLKVSYDDFIILAPNIQEYKIPVMQIFNQIDKDSDKIEKEKDAVEFPYLPYIFSDFSGVHSAVEEATKIFISILKKNSLFRTDLFSLLRNPVIKSTRSFSEEELSAWSNWVTNLQGFRNSKYRPDEWKILRNRLLISLLTEENFKVNNTIYKPYSDMESQSNECLFKFIDAVDKLEDWRNNFATKTELNKDDIKKIQDFFAYWFTIPSDNKEVVAGEKVVYASIKKEILNQKILLSAGYDTINADSFFMALKDNARGSKGSSSNLYVGGITFSTFTQNRTIPAKYVYLLGLNSNVFPKMDSELSLDLRKKLPAQPGDTTVSEMNKQTFLCQLMAAGKKLYISYVNKNLMKDEELFHSSVVDDLQDFIGESNIFKKEITIDEVRNWEDLYTQRSFRNKTNFKDLLTPKNTNPTKKKSEIPIPPQRVSIHSLNNFLSNPFIFYAKSIFETKDNEEGENESITYEPLELNIFENKDISDAIIFNILKMLYEKAIKKSGSIQNLEDIIQDKIKENIEELKLKKVIYDDIFGQVSALKLKDQIFTIVNLINSKYEIDKGKSDFQFEKNTRLFLSFENDDKKVTKWELTGKLCPYCFNKKENTLIVLYHGYSKEIKTKNKIEAYLTAIAKIAEEYDDDTPVTVELCIISNSGNIVRDFKLNKTITSKEAITILNNIYKQMYVESYRKMLLVNNTRETGIITDYENIGKFISALNEDSDWKYFSQNKLFNPYKDIGIKTDSFIKNTTTNKSNYENNIEKWKSFVPGLF